MTDREVMQQALDVIIELYNDRGEKCEQNKELFVVADKVIASLEAALAQPEQDHGFDRTASHMAGEYVDTAEQEPVAFIWHAANGHSFLLFNNVGKEDCSTPLYTAPPKPEQEPFKPDWVNYRQGLEDGAAQPEQEPVAWMTNSEHEYSLEYKFNWLKTPLHDIPLYTAPPKRKWVGLTDDDIENLWNGVQWSISDFVIPFTRAVEAKLKEKNSV